MRTQVGEWYKENSKNIYSGMSLKLHLENILHPPITVTSERGATKTYTKNDVDEYIEDFKKKSFIWGDERTVWALAHLYKLRIIICSLEDTNTKKNKMISDTDFVFEHDTEYKPGGDPIYIKFETIKDATGNNASHYSGLCLTEHKTCQDRIEQDEKTKQKK